MPGSNFEAQKPSKQDKKRFRNICANNPKTILMFDKGKDNHFQCQEAILKPKNYQHMTKRDFEIFTQITRVSVQGVKSLGGMFMPGI